MTTDFAQMSLTNLDLVCAISQQQLNGAVATALAEAAPLVHFAFANSGGEWVTPTKQNPAAISFSGTWAPVVDRNSGQLRVPIIDMSQGAFLTAGQVILNLTFDAGATLTDTLVKKTYVQPDPSSDATALSSIWVVPITVSLSTAALEGSNIPQQVQKQLDILNGQYGNIFSVQQIVADLSSLVTDGRVVAKQPDGIDDISWPLFQKCLGLYLKNAESLRKIPLACLITQNAGTPKVSPPEFTPTSADFVVIPNPTSPGLSALVFAMMSQNRLLPGTSSSLTLAECFTGVGFTDPNATGTFVIREGLLAAVINNALSNSQVPAVLSFYLAVNSPSANSDYASFSLTQDANIPPLTTVVPSSSNNYQIVAFSYGNSQSNGQSTLVSGWGGNSRVDNSMSVLLAPSATSETPSRIDIEGSIVISCSASSNAALSSDSAQLEPTTFSWNASFQLQTDDANPGLIDFNITVSNFDTPPTTQSGSGWDTFLATITSTNMDPSFGGIRDKLCTYLKSTVQNAFVTGFGNLQSFVLPGNNVFSFSSAFINMGCNLVVDMQYRDLGEAAPAARR